MNRSYSIDLLPKLQESRKTNHSLSVYSLDLNEKSRKKFQLVNGITNKHTIEYKLESIKNALRGKQEKIEFDELLNRIDVITNETRFIKDRIVLSEKNPVKGYLDENSSQFFEFSVKGNFSPVRIAIDVEKGEVISYASFTNPSPNSDFYDKRSEKGLLEVHSRYNIFTESKLYVGIFAICNSRLSISYSFKKAKERKLTKKQPRNPVIKEHSYVKDIQLMRDNPNLKMEFEKKVNEILAKRRSKERLNFINLNKSIANISTTTEMLSTKIKFQLEKKHEEVKKRKVIITEEKIKTLKAKIMRVELRKEAERQAQEINAIITRKENFEKKWLVLLEFSIISSTWKERFKGYRQAKIDMQIKKMKAYIIQKKFRTRFSKPFSFPSRVKAIARNHLIAMHMTTFPVLKRISGGLLVKSIEEMCKYQQIIDAFDKLNHRIIAIQRCWKEYCKIQHQRYIILMNFWGKVAQDTIASLGGNKGKKKKKNHAAEKIMDIPLHLKEKKVRELMNESKLRFIEKIRAGDKKSGFDYMIPEEDMKKLIMNLTVQKGKMNKKSVTIHEKK